MLRRSLMTLGLTLAVLVIATPALIVGQAPSAKAPTGAKGAAAGAPAKRSGYVVHRLPWGDPDLSGNFTTKDEANTPFERPDEFAGRRLEDITPEELAKANEVRRREA